MVGRNNIDDDLYRISPSETLEKCRSLTRYEMSRNHYATKTTATGPMDSPRSGVGSREQMIICNNCEGWIQQ